MITLANTDNLATNATEENDISTPVTYTQEQLDENMRNAYQQGYQVGVRSALKQVRSEINDYLSDLIASIKNDN